MRYTVYEHKYCKTKKNIKYEDDINDPKWVLEYSEKIISTWMYQESNNTRTQTTNAHIASNHAGIFMDYITHTWFTFILRLTNYC